tara:strand:+ start:2157 stop:3005 length:849 start_codon:yes stop_codon:yes gene_type:complete
MISKTQKIKAGLYLVSTPIGNLEDITIRALNILRKSDIILCEDTRVSAKLLSFFQIKKKLFSYHKFNEKKSTSKLIDELRQGKILSLISDAGTPAVSDPGRILINECVDNNIPIIPIPGASSVTASASISGFSEKFIFFGFLSEKESTMIKELEMLGKINCAIIIFSSPRKFLKNLKKFQEYFEDREVVICREMTKLHEEFVRLKVNNLTNLNLNIKGELTVIFSEKKNIIKNFNYLNESDKKKIEKMLKKKTIKDIVKEFKGKGIPKRIIYNYCLEKKNEN